MEQPTKEDITKKINAVLNGNLSREEVYEWTRYYIKNDFQIDINDIDAWHYLVEISNIDEMIFPGEYLFSNEDIQNIMKKYINIRVL